MSRSKGFIKYQIRHGKRMNIENAEFCRAQRIGNKKKNNEVWLGRVIDKENNIFYTKTDGYYSFTVDNGKKEIDNILIDKYKSLDKKMNNNKDKSQVNARSHSIDFGDIYLLHEYIKSNSLFDVFKSINTNDIDTLCCLIFFRILCNKSYTYVYEWWFDTYLKYIFPNAKLHSQRISEFLENIGSENNFSIFFDSYINYLKILNPKFNILIDSTGLSNSINIPLTAINNHGGAISNEIRLILIADKLSGLPIYYRYVPGNVVDVSTLSMVITELREYNIDINKAILDAGYFSEENIKKLYENEIPFMTRMVERTEKYELILKKFIPQIKDKHNFVRYSDRSLFIKKEKINFFDTDIPLNCYICQDIQKEGLDRTTYYKNFNDKTKTNDDMYIDLLTHGVFILISSIDLEIKDVLPCYYDRQAIEQIFDYMKNYIDIIPLRIHNEKTFAGHLLISFMASVLYLSLDKEIKKYNKSLYSVIESFHRLHCRVFSNKLIADIPVKKVNEILKLLKITIPNKICLNNENK
jgi:hypothetical protein